MDCVDIKVGIADLKVGKKPDKLTTIGLGSCIGIAILDPVSGVAGLSHIMLPSSDKFSDVKNKMKFANLAIPLLVDEMVKIGASVNRMRAKIAGGASMFSFSDSSVNMDIGERNGKAVKEALKALNIPIDAEDIGGKRGRTITFDSVTGILHIKTVGQGVKDI